MGLRRKLAVAAALAGVAVVGIGYLVVGRQASGSLDDASTRTDAIDCAQSVVTRERMSVPFDFGRRRVDVLGDSYSVGADLDDPRSQTWDVLLAREEHWHLTVHGEGRTGFVNRGFCGDQPYASRTHAVRTDRPALVIVEGGLNDVGLPGLKAAATHVLQLLHGLRVVVVGPTSAPALSASGEDAVSHTLAEVAGRRYIPALGWPVQFNAGGVHMTPAGHREYASHLAAALARHGDARALGV